MSICFFNLYNYKIVLKKIFLIVLFFIFSANISFAKTNTSNQQSFYQAKVTQIISQGQISKDGQKNYFQKILVLFETGPDKGKRVEVTNGIESQIEKTQLVSPGQEIVVSETRNSNGKADYTVYDFYRLNSLLILTLVFFVSIILIAGAKGIGSIFGMLLSLLVILFFIVPNIIKGQDPLTVTLIGSSVIIVLSTYIAHGISKKTTVALFSTLLTLILTVVLAELSMHLNNITGLGNEDFYSLQISSSITFNIRGLFLSAVIIGTLGALNDITTTQAATVLELKKANPKLKFIDLLEKGFNVGKEHIASLVNTLILAYVGSAFAVFIFLILNPAHLPYWVILNNEIIADEVVKIISGSIGLLLSVPIVTFIASFVFSEIKS